MNFILSAEAACDLDKELAKKYSVSVMPMKFLVNGEEFYTADGKMTPNEICAQMEKGAKTSTTQPNEFEIKEYLEGLIKEKKDVLHLSFSSAMSGTCEAFKRIAEEINQENDNKIYVVDTLCQSFGVALLLSIINEKAQKEDLSAKSAAEYLEEIKLSVSHWFAVDTLTYLARGGRVSSSLAVLANLVNIKPVLNVNDAGKIVMVSKAMGKRRAIKAIVERFKNSYTPITKTVFIGNSACIEEAEAVKEELLKINPELNIVIGSLGPIITCHSGPGTLAIFFTCQERIAK